MFYSDHAVEQMEVRGISREDVKRVLYTGTVAQSSYQPAGGMWRYARELQVRGQMVRVIFSIKPQRYDIITVFWVTK